MNFIADRKKVAIIGLDGATPQIIEKLIANNKLLFFKNLKQQGIHGQLKSTIPVNGACSWASFFSGKNPGKHNIYDYLDFQTDPTSPEIIQNNSIKAPMLWDFASKAGLKSFFFNIPILTAPLAVNGILVSGFLSPNQPAAYPEAVSEELKRLDMQLDAGANGTLKPADYFKKIVELFKKQTKFFTAKIQTTDWDLMVGTFNILDRVQKKFWDDESKIEEAYSLVDSELQSFAEQIGPENFLLVLSNFGYSTVKRKFFVNEWLWEKKLLQRTISTQKGLITNIDDFISNHKNGNGTVLTDLLTKYGFTKSNIRSVLPTELSEKLKTTVPRTIKKLLHREYLHIDWKKTQAYFVSENLQGININLKGREPWGIINPGTEYENLRDKIISDLYHLTDPYSLDNVVDEVFRKEELFCGKYLEGAPDIILVPHSNKYALDPSKRTSRLSIGAANDDVPILSQPNREGVLFATGPDIKPGFKINGATIYDILPTVLSLLSINCDDDFDGKILFKIFDETSASGKNQQPNFIPEDDLLPFLPEEIFKKNVPSTLPSV